MIFMLGNYIFETELSNAFPLATLERAIMPRMEFGNSFDFIILHRIVFRQ